MIGRPRDRGAARVTGARLLLFGEAYGLVLLAAPAVRFLPFRTLMRIASLPARRARPLDAATRQRVRWAIDAAARRSPFRALCFERGLAAQIMLRRRGIDATLCYGVAPGSDKPLDAHVWIVVGEAGVIGTENAADFALLLRAPGG